MTNFSQGKTCVAPMSKVQPIATLSEEDGFVLIITDSGHSNTPYGSHVGRRVEGGHIRDFGGNGIEGEYGEKPIAWMPIPFTAEEVKAAQAAGDALSNPAQDTLEGDPEDHLAMIRQAIKEMSEDTLTPRRALLRMHRALGDDEDGPALPQDAPKALVQARFQLTRWVHFSMYDEEAIDEIAGCLHDNEAVA